MTHRSRHLITVRTILPSWAFTAEIISMIDAAMSFGTRSVFAQINLTMRFFSFENFFFVFWVEFSLADGNLRWKTEKAEKTNEYVKSKTKKKGEIENFIRK